MTLSEEEIKKLLQMVSKQHQSATADEIRHLIVSQGGHPEQDKESRCRAFASLLRSLLNDPPVQRLLRLALERSQFQTIVEALSERMQQSKNPDDVIIARSLVTRMASLGKEVEGEINQIVKAEEAKLWLIDSLVGMLRSLGCDERFDLPAVTLRLPKFDAPKDAR